MAILHYNQDNASQLPFGGFHRVTLKMAAKTFNLGLLNVSGFLLYYLCIKYRVGDYVYRSTISKDLKDEYKSIGLDKPLTDRQIDDARRYLIKKGWIQQDEKSVFVWVPANQELGIVDSSFKFVDTKPRTDDTKKPSVDTKSRTESTESRIDNTEICTDDTKNPTQKTLESTASKDLGDLPRYRDIPERLESLDDKTLQIQGRVLSDDKKSPDGDANANENEGALPDAPLTGDAPLKQQSVAVDLDLTNEMASDIVVELIGLVKGEAIGSNIDPMIRLDLKAAKLALKELKALIDSGVDIPKKVGKFVRLFEKYCSVEIPKSAPKADSKPRRDTISTKEESLTSQPQEPANPETSEPVVEPEPVEEPKWIYAEPEKPLSRVTKVVLHHAEKHGEWYSRRGNGNWAKVLDKELMLQIYNGGGEIYADHTSFASWIDYENMKINFQNSHGQNKPYIEIPKPDFTP